MSPLEHKRATSSLIGYTYLDALRLLTSLSHPSINQLPFSVLTSLCLGRRRFFADGLNLPSFDMKFGPLASSK